MHRGQSRHNLTLKTDYDRKFIDENHDELKKAKEWKPQEINDKVELNVRKTLASSNLSNKLMTKSAHKVVHLADENWENESDVRTDKSDGHDDIDRIFDDIDSVDEDSDDDDADSSVGSHEKRAQRYAAENAQHNQPHDRFMSMGEDAYGADKKKFTSLVDVHKSFMNTVKEEDKSRQIKSVASMRTLVKHNESIYSPQHEKNPFRTKTGMPDYSHLDGDGSDDNKSQDKKKNSSFLFLSKLISPKKEKETLSGDLIQAIAKGTVSPDNRVVDARSVNGKWSVNKAVSQTTANTLNDMQINIGTKIKDPETSTFKKKQSFLDKVVEKLTEVTPEPKPKPVKTTTPQLHKHNVFTQGELIESKPRLGANTVANISHDDFIKMISTKPPSSAAASPRTGASSVSGGGSADSPKKGHPGQFVADLTTHEMILSSKKKYPSSSAPSTPSSVSHKLPEINSPTPQIHPAKYDPRNTAHRLNNNNTKSSDHLGPNSGPQETRDHSVNAYRDTLTPQSHHFLSSWTNRQRVKEPDAEEKQRQAESVSKYAVRNTAGVYSVDGQIDPYADNSVPTPDKHSFISESKSSLSRAQPSALSTIQVPKLDVYNETSPHRKAAENERVQQQFFDYPSQDLPEQFNSPDITAPVDNSEFKFQAGANAYVSTTQTNNAQFGMRYRNDHSVHPHTLQSSERFKNAVADMSAESQQQPIIYIPHNAAHGHAMVPTLDDLMADHPSQTSRRAHFASLAQAQARKKQLQQKEGAYGVNENDSDDDDWYFAPGQQSSYGGTSSVGDGVPAVQALPAGTALAGSSYSEIWGKMSSPAGSSSNILGYDPRSPQIPGKHYNSEKSPEEKGIFKLHKETSSSYALPRIDAASANSIGGKERGISSDSKNCTDGDNGNFKGFVSRHGNTFDPQHLEGGEEDDPEVIIARSNQRLFDAKEQLKLRMEARYAMDKEGDHNKQQKVKQYIKEGNSDNKRIIASYLKEMDGWHPTKEIVHKHDTKH